MSSWKKTARRMKIRADGDHKRQLRILASLAVALQMISGGIMWWKRREMIARETDKVSRETRCELAETV